MAFKDPYGAHRKAGIPMIGASWRDTEIDGDDIAGMIFQDCEFERVRLTGTSLWQTVFVNCRLSDCEFADCRLFRTQWVDCSGSGFRITGGEFAEAVFSKCRFKELALDRSGERLAFASCERGRLAFNGDGCRQHGLTVSDCTFDAVAAENASFTSATAVAADLRVWSLEHAVLDHCLLVEVQAEGLDLSTVRLNTCNLFKGNLRETRIRHAPGSIFAECDCSGADFAEAELDGALFAKALAENTRFAGASLNNAMFPESTLIGADFRGASARQSVWTGADLTDAGFEGVDAWRGTFRNAVFGNTRLAGASLVEADVHGVDGSLEGADLRDSRGTTAWRAEREAEARRPTV